MSEAKRDPAGGASPSWRRSSTRVGIAVSLLVIAVTVLVQLPRALKNLGDRATRSSSFTYEDRAFAAGNSIIPDKQLLYEAKAWIPARGSYRVEVGPRPVTGAMPLTRYAGLFATYYLMPRRPSPDARWALCLGCDPGSLASHVTTLWSDHNGSSLLRIDG
ncbi:MAG: hypothetical protein ACXVY8_04645 [Gaiellaceae bacterium]